MTLARLLAGADLGRSVPEASATREAMDRAVLGVTHDSRQVEPGSVFVAIAGAQVDGRGFWEDAARRGAIAVVSESPAPPGATCPWVRVGDARLALAALAAELWEHPSRRLDVIGITGTNGKTTTAYLIAAIMDRAGRSCGRLGTVSYRVGSSDRQARLTTPEAPDIQRLLREMLDAGCAACVMEVSSHALALKRVERTHFASAVFTNLTRDHLDFHGDMERYFEVKRRLFDMLPPEAPAVINVDDPRGRTLVEAVRHPLTYGVDRPADVAPGAVESSLSGLAFDVRVPRGVLRIRSRLLGRFNLHNISAAVATGVALKLPGQAIEAGIADVEIVPGRLERVSDAADDVTVVIDYAHTDDALKHLLESVRSLASGRVVTVFGCGGDRDRTKRPLMGAVASRLSDLVIVTSDNPRSEDPSAIIEEIVRGLVPRGQAPATPFVRVEDRGEAIARAIREALRGDLIVVAGKGHETSQVIGGRAVAFDDARVAREALARRRRRPRAS